MNCSCIFQYPCLNVRGQRSEISFEINFDTYNYYITHNCCVHTFSILGTEDHLRQRKQKSTGEDLDVLLKYHHSMQEKIADDMLLLTRNLKEQSLLANSIIRKDTEACY